MLVHPGGPFWARKDDGAWSIPKGEFDAGESPLEAAVREFTEETGIVPETPFILLGSVKQPSGKIITSWAFERDWDPSMLRSNSFTLEWPPRSGLTREYPEVDRAAWFDLITARRKILPAQIAFLDELRAQLRIDAGDDSQAVGQQSLFG
jgi:predicted NUDIX family NTP pyrophosphohydrolase